MDDKFPLGNQSLTNIINPKQLHNLFKMQVTWLPFLLWSSEDWLQTSLMKADWDLARITDLREVIKIVTTHYIHQV